jgi:hypothetical protein
VTVVHGVFLWLSFSWWLAAIRRQLVTTERQLTVKVKPLAAIRLAERYIRPAELFFIK